ncbi:MAG: SDR family NAD(P)-dependent oxidoreductase [Bacteroidetes bacterium]|nr:SDR family NAD(P)-dependent oxidoreductase [Bacteroidota bacterium]MBT4339515.1 SDR family NAD(P)-dependent oxidoreductase [Bacteroidota bacterium]
MKNKRILITGSTSGIGRASAKELAKMGANIVLVSRNEEKLKTQVEELKKATNNESIDYIQGDLSSLADIRKVAEIYRNRYTELDVLLNNAGLIVPDHRTTTDGYE